MSNLIKGTKQPQIQGRPGTSMMSEREFVRGQGWTNVHIWEGTVDEIFGMAEGLSSDYDRISVVSSDNVTARLRATFGGTSETPDDQEILSNDWELVGSGIQEDIRFHDGYALLDYRNQALIEKWLKDEALRESAASPPFVLPINDAGAFYDMLRNGQSAFQRSYSILRNTKTVTNPFVIDVAMTNIERRHLQSQLPTIDNSGVAAAVSNLGDAGPPFTIRTEYEWSWLKQRPQISGAAFARAQISQEWWLYSWSKVLYPAAT
jgi:hypothetical protein